MTAQRGEVRGRRRDEVLFIRVTAVERQRIEQALVTRSISDWSRTVLLREAHRAARQRAARQVATARALMEAGSDAA